MSHAPLGLLDGPYHDMNPRGRVIALGDPGFRPTAVGSMLNAAMARVPFLHSHMQVIVARRPDVCC